MLEGPRFHTPRHHQPGMGICGHVVCGLRVQDRLHYLVPALADIQINRLGRFKQPIQMLSHKRPGSIVEPQALPDSIAKHETAVIDTDFRFCLGDDFAVQIDQDIFVPLIFLRLMRAHFFAHGVLLWRHARRIGSNFQAVTSPHPSSPIRDKR